MCFDDDEPVPQKRVDPEIERLTQRLLATQLAVAEESAKKVTAEMRLAAATAELHEIHESFAVVLAEQCADDERHCTCVPVLRRRLDQSQRYVSDANEKVNELTQRLAAAEEATVKRLELISRLSESLAAAEARVSELTTKLARRCRAETCDKEALLAAHIELRERLEDIQTINRTLTIKVAAFEDRCENDRAKEVCGD